MKYHCILLFLILTNWSFGQAFSPEEEVVNASAAFRSDSSSSWIEVILQVDSGWIVYDSVSTQDGPLPLKIQIQEQQNISIKQIVKPSLKQKHDDVFECDIYYFTGEKKYKILVEKGNKTQPSSVLLTLECMSCNLGSGVCLPPSVYSFHLVDK